MTTVTLDETKPHVSIRCPCGGTATAGSAKEDGAGFVVHSVPECDDFVRLEPADFLAWARKHGAVTLPLPEGVASRSVWRSFAAANVALPKLSKAQREGLVEAYNDPGGVAWLAENTVAVLMRYGLVERIHPTARGVRLTIAGRPVAAAIVLEALNRT